MPSIIPRRIREIEGYHKIIFLEITTDNIPNQEKKKKERYPGTRRTEDRKNDEPNIVTPGDKIKMTEVKDQENSEGSKRKTESYTRQSQ